MFRFKILARRTDFDGATFRITFALESFFKNLYEKGEFMARFNTEKLPGNGNLEGSTPMRMQTGCRCRIEDYSILTCFKNRYQFGGSGMTEGDLRWMWEKEANGDGFGRAAQIQLKVEIRGNGSSK